MVLLYCVASHRLLTLKCISKDCPSDEDLFCLQANYFLLFPMLLADTLKDPIESRHRVPFLRVELHIARVHSIILL